MKKNKVTPSVNVSSNISWTIQKGSWIAHIIITTLLSLLFVQLLGLNLGMQYAIITYNVCSFIFFHWIVGDPFNSDYKDCTFWEQMAIQLGHTSTLKFMALYPVAFFMIAHTIVTWNVWLLIVASITLALVVIPKLGFMHMKRVFGIKRYD